MINLSDHDYYAIKDIARKLWQDARKPDVNKVMFKALQTYLIQVGSTPGFNVVDEVEINDQEGIDND
jgi:hypothetical protein